MSTSKEHGKNGTNGNVTVKKLTLNPILLWIFILLTFQYLHILWGHPLFFIYKFIVLRIRIRILNQYLLGATHTWNISVPICVKNVYKIDLKGVSKKGPNLVSHFLSTLSQLSSKLSTVWPSSVYAVDENVFIFHCRAKYKWDITRIVNNRLLGYTFFNVK